MNDTSATARALRGRYRAELAQQRGHACLTECAALLAARDLDSAADAVLDAVSRYTGAAHAGLLRRHGERLLVAASRGAAPPRGGRLPGRAGVQAALRWPAHSLLRVDVDLPWFCLAAPLGYELWVPLAARAQVTGALVLGGDAALIPGHDERATLDALGGFLGGLWPVTAAAPRLDERSRRQLAQLTSREREVLSLLPRGYSNARIAAELGIGAGTVKSHVEHLLRKLALDDRTQAAARAVEWRLGSSRP